MSTAGKRSLPTTSRLAEPVCCRGIFHACQTAAVEAMSSRSVAVHCQSVSPRIFAWAHAGSPRMNVSGIIQPPIVT